MIKQSKILHLRRQLKPVQTRFAACSKDFIGHVIHSADCLNNAETNNLTLPYNPNINKELVAHSDR